MVERLPAGDVRKQIREQGIAFQAWQALDFDSEALVDEQNLPSGERMPTRDRMRDAGHLPDLLLGQGPPASRGLLLPVAIAVSMTARGFATLDCWGPVQLAAQAFQSLCPGPVRRRCRFEPDASHRDQAGAGRVLPDSVQQRGSRGRRVRALKRVLARSIPTGPGEPAVPQPTLLQPRTPRV